MAERQDFRELQREFAAHIRDPKNAPPPKDVEDRRMAIYRDLFFNNVAGLLAGTFPVLRRILGEDDWRQLVRDYFSVHRSRTPYFLEMPQEFLEYLQNERGQRDNDPDWLLELAHYEWVELALAVSEEEPDWSAIDRDGDLLRQPPVLSPLAWPLSYRYPVHRIGPEFQPATAPGSATFLVVYRGPDDKVGFMEVNAVTARLLELMQSDDQRNGENLLATIATQLGQSADEHFLEAGRQALAELRDRHILLGTRRPQSSK